MTERIFYDTEKNGHGLPHDPFKAIVSPRPIGWIGTKGRDGSTNLGPYSFFNAIADHPKLVLFSSSGYKHSARNAEETGVFTASLASRHLAEAVNQSSIAAPYGTSEFALSGLSLAPGRLVDAPFVAEAYAALECRVTEIFRPKDLDGAPTDNFVVIGQVVGIHIDPKVLTPDGHIDMKIAAPLARLGYLDYSDGSETFQMVRPRWQAS